MERKSSSCFSGHFLHADVLQRDAQQIAQLRDHVVGGIDVAVHQRRNRVERVEEEMRLQLPLQRLQLRFDEMRFELALAQLRDPAPRCDSAARG